MPAARWRRLHEVRQLDPEADCHAIARLITNYEFPWDMLRSLDTARIARTSSVVSTSLTT